MAKEFIFVEIIISILLWSPMQGSHVKTCLNENPCSCKLEEYVEINLAPLNTQQLQVTLGNVTYFFMGCQDRALGNNILNATTNETASLFKYVYNGTQNMTIIGGVSAIGKAKDIQFEVGPDPDSKNKYFLAYREKESKSVPTIHLVCIEYEKSGLTIDSSSSDALILYSPAACNVAHHHGMNTGSILIIIFLVGTVAYFLLGGVGLYLVRGARGIEVVPNLDFWRGLPGLVKDGLIFVFSGCRPTYVSTADTYDKI